MCGGGRLSVLCGDVVLDVSLRMCGVGRLNVVWR